ncbi:MAG: hypothetical protein RLZZ546_345 [Bacteroidota bacterium]|jgi:ribosomal protein L29
MAKKKEILKSEDLTKKITELQESIRSINFNKGNSKTKNVKELSNLKKNLAQLLTEFNKSNKNN